jgi:hypothetical protein
MDQEHEMNVDESSQQNEASQASA